MQRLITTLFLLIALSNSAYSIDKELAESLKCINHIKYFEKRMKFPENTLLALGIQESGRILKKYKRPIAWPWAVNLEGKGHYFESKKEAVDFVKQNIREGKRNIDVGCMQVNLKHHPRAFRSIEKAFSPKYNIGYAADFLSKKYKQTKSWSKAIAHYHSSNEEKGRNYKNKVFTIANNINKYADPYVRFHQERKKQMAINLSPKNIMAKNKAKSRIQFAKKSERYKSDILVDFTKKNSNKNAS